MTEHYKLLKEAFVKKIGFVFVLAIICAGGLAAEKYFTSDFMVESGGFTVSALTKIDDPFLKEHPYVEFNYDAWVHTNENLDEFLAANEATEKYAFNKIYGDWKTLKGEKKYDWLNRHFITRNFNNGVMEFTFEVKENEAKDIEYLKEYGSGLLDDFIQQTEKNIQLVRPDTKIEIIRRDMVVPEYIELSKKDVIIKYSIIGFILGGCLATLIIFIMALGRKR